MCNSKIKIKRNDTIRIIAIITMLIDHIGAFIFPELIFLRIIGRLAMPIFAYGLAQGILHTSNPKKYAFRLFIFACISQIPFYLLGNSDLNIIFTILFTLIAIEGIRLKGKYYIMSIISLIVLIFVPMDYGIYFAVLAYSFYIFYNNSNKAIVSGALITVFFSLFYYSNPNQLYSIIGILLIYINRIVKIPKIYAGKYLFYIFYPLHMLIIYLVKILY